MKKNILRIILIILLILTFIKIFDFSSQNSEKSGGLSRGITIKITQNIKLIQNLEEEKKERTLSIIEKIIRKLAHFTEYAIVGILLMSLFCTYNLPSKKRFLFSTLIGLLYACTDEIHQLFVPGRNGAITDVMIDTMGVLFGEIIIYLIIKGMKNKR